MTSTPLPRIMAMWHCPREDNVRKLEVPKKAQAGIVTSAMTQLLHKGAFVESAHGGQILVAPFQGHHTSLLTPQLAQPASSSSISSRSPSGVSRVVDVFILCHPLSGSGGAPTVQHASNPCYSISLIIWLIA